MADKIDIGNQGEQLAAEFMAAKGFEIVVRNYRYKHAEIDMIVKRNDWIVFIEVKTRTSSEYGEPEDAVGDIKIGKLYEAAEEYIFATDWQGHVRFDVISVKLGRVPLIEHFEDAIN